LKHHKRKQGIITQQRHTKLHDTIPISMEQRHGDCVMYPCCVMTPCQAAHH
jgi:hypothetical protein